MFSFFKSPECSKPISANEIIDKLEINADPGIQSILSFNKDYQTLHCNTYLLQALAWNRLNAACQLLDLDKKNEAVNLKDSWPTCLNTPLILAAKIDAGKMLGKLIDLGANVNEQDYRGYTALHYACILRNDLAIEKLISANANLQISDAFGKTPYDYYQMEFTKMDLGYRYGETAGYLNFVPDKNNHYFATHKKCLSALRWYIPHLIVNNNLGKSDFIKKISLYDYAKNRLLIREPVHNTYFYEAMMDCFLNYRPKMNMALAKKLFSSFNTYQEGEHGIYRLDPLDLVPQSAVHIDKNNNICIELQEIRSSSRERNLL